MLTTPTSTEATEWSLFTDLTRRSGRSFAATDSIKELLEWICSCVCDLKRNTQISYRFARRAADIYVAINMRIEKVDAASEAVLVNEFADRPIGPAMEKLLKDRVSAVWKDFKEYSAAINELEATLLRFADVAAEESNLGLPDGTVNTIEDCSNFVCDWSRNRSCFQDFCRHLHSVEALQAILTADFDIVASMRRDDFVLLSALCNNFYSSVTSISASEERGKLGHLSSATKMSMVHEIPSKAGSLTTDVTHSTIVHCVRFTMLLCGAVRVLTTSVTIEVEHLRSKPVWNQDIDGAESLLLLLISHLEQPVLPDQEIAEKIDAFQQLLQNIAGAVRLPRTYLELKKAAKGIRPPLRSQMLTLISQCRTLASHFNKEEAKRSINFDIMDTAIGAALGALAMAENGTPTTELDETGKVFAEAEEKIRQCFIAYGLGREWNSEKKVLDGLKDDTVRVRQMNSRQIA